MKYFNVQILFLLLLGSYYTTSYGQTNINQNNAVTPTASNFAYPQSVFIDSHSGHIWVTDFDNNRVLRFDVSTLTNLDEIKTLSPPVNFSLEQNFPNPFNPTTKISWQSPVSGWQTLKVYDVLGNEVATLIDEYKNAGSYEVEFKSSVGSIQLASGIYFYKLQAGDFIQTKKMVLIK
jgi:hypothetical protein